MSNFVKNNSNHFSYMENKTSYTFNPILMWILFFIGFFGSFLSETYRLDPEIQNTGLPVVGDVCVAFAYAAFMSCLIKKFKEEGVTTPSARLITLSIVFYIFGTLTLVLADGGDMLSETGWHMVGIVILCLVIIDIVLSVKLFKTNYQMIGITLALSDILPLGLSIYEGLSYDSEPVSPKIGIVISCVGQLFLFATMRTVLSQSSESEEVTAE